jgi:hypothetical protein
MISQMNRTRSGRTVSRLLSVATASVAFSALLLAPSSPAAAAANGDYIATDVRIRACPTTSCTIHGLGYPGHGAYITCYKIGDYLSGSSYWYYHRNKRTGVTGYSHSSLLDFSSGTVPRC